MVNYDAQSTMTSMNTMDSDSDLEQSEDRNTGQNEYSDINIQKITLKNGLGSMRKRKQEAVLRTAKYNVHNNQKNTITQNFCCITHGLMKRKS